VYHTQDTIAAIASAPGGAARGIVRLSGPDVVSILSACCASDSLPSLADIAQPQVASRRIELTTGGQRSLPADLYIWPDERSYTRQPAAEIHTIGSPPLLSALLRRLCEAGARLAEPGEFTLRAFLAGRIDLVQAEAVLSVIEARGQGQFQSALRQLAGDLSRPLNQLRESLLELLAHLEAGLDFVEEDIEFVSRGQVAAQLQQAAELLARTSTQLASRGRGDEPARVTIVGWPNVGKSSLFNALAGSAALVSDVPGTTRDYLIAEATFGGQQCLLIDTAGHESEARGGEILHAANELAQSQAATCDIELLCLDMSRPANAWELARLSVLCPGIRLVVGTKADRQAGLPKLPIDLITSATSGEGLSALRTRLDEVLAGIDRDASGSALTAERCADSLQAAAAAVARARALNASGEGEELIAAELRLALGELGRVVGAVYTDDILDRVFSRFCIGK